MATLDKNSPEGKNVIRWVAAGAVALICTFLLDFVVSQDSTIWLVVTCILLLIVIVCAFGARSALKKAKAAGAYK